MTPAAISVEQRRRRRARRHHQGSHRREGRDARGGARALGPIHSTDPATPYLAIHARAEVSIDDVDAALYDEVSLRRFTTIRRTVFAMDAEVASAAFAAANSPIVETLRRQLIGWLDASDDVDGDAASFLAHVEAQVVAELRSGGPRSGAQLAEAIPDLAVRFEPKPGASYSRPQRITSKVLEILGTEMRIVRSRPTGADFTSGAWRWAAADPRWLDEVADVSPDAALVRLLVRYLDACAPATVTDMTWFTGTTKTRVRRALGELGAVEVELAEADEPGFVLTDDPWLDGREEPEPDSGATVALVPGLDPTTMAWKQRAWYVDDSAGVGVFDRNGNAGPTIWVDGSVVGVWTQRSDGEMVMEILDGVDVPDDRRVQIEEEAERIAGWLGDVRVNWRYPTPITKRLES
ncbi:MAG: winged helix DNA-binding domain-containing protein [Actinomycetota bacterium]